MKDGLVCLSLIFALMVVNERAFFNANELNKPIPMMARQLAISGADLVGLDRAEEGVALLRESVKLAPNYVWAHQQYFSARANNQGQYDQVRAEYDRLIANQPDNPIYPLVVALTARVPYTNLRQVFEKIIELCPDWSWAHYAKAILYNEDGKVELAAMELAKCIELDDTAEDAYRTLIHIQENRLMRIDAAISTAERMVAQPECRVTGLYALWRSRLNKAQGSEAVISTLRAELARLTSTTKDIGILAAVRTGYSQLLNDSAAADRAERAIRRIDPAWYPERGRTLFIASTREDGIPRPLLVSGEQFAIFSKVDQIGELEPKERLSRLDKLLALNPGPEMKTYIYQRLLEAAEKLKNTSAFVKYGERLRELEPDDMGLLARISIALANESLDLERALRYARLADEATSELRPVHKRANTTPEWFSWSFPESRWRDNYKRQRSLALDAVGWVLCKLGDYRGAESKLRQSIAIVRGERNLLHLAEILKRLGRIDESEAAVRDANNVWLESLKRRFVNRPSKDFQLQGLRGQKIRLSELRNKVVLVNFWATWCGPCAEEMPHLVALFKKHKPRGFEILAISVDSKSERYKVASFAAAHKLPFPVLFDDGVSDLYQVKAYPTTIFVDRSGNVRHMSSGFDADEPRVLEAIVNELLK